MEQPHPIVTQRNVLAARCLDLELEIIARDQRIVELETRIKGLAPDPATV